MYRHYYFRAFRHRLMWTISCLAMIFVTGCSSTVSRIQTWEGAAEDASQVAVLEAPSEIKVSRVNGRRMGSFLVDDLALDYELLPGQNEVVFTYKTLWAKTDIVEDGESKVYVVETKPHVLLIDAKPGETYRFQIDTPDSRAEAEAYAADFSVDLVSASGAVVASSQVWTPGQESRVARSPLPENDPSDGSESNTGTLGQLKALWGKATEEEKREFLRWAFE